jgi:hypothetical protein
MMKLHIRSKCGGSKFIILIFEKKYHYSNTEHAEPSNVSWTEWTSRMNCDVDDIDSR